MKQGELRSILDFIQPDSAWYGRDESWIGVREKSADLTEALRLLEASVLPARSNGDRTWPAVWVPVERETWEEMAAEGEDVDEDDREEPEGEEEGEALGAYIVWLGGQLRKQIESFLHSRWEGAASRRAGRKPGLSTDAPGGRVPPQVLTPSLP